MDPRVCSHKLSLRRGSRTDKVIAEALDAASRSYAPYKTGKSFNYAGVALELTNGWVYAGRHAENAAYNPSLSPFQSAVTFLNLARSSSGAKIKRCVLVEVPTLASQLAATQAALAAYAPGLRLEYYPARIVSN